MEEILHQLVDSLSRYLQGFIHPRWCRISSINSIIGVSGHSSHWKLRRTTSLVHSWQTKTWLSLGKPPFSIQRPLKASRLKIVNYKPLLKQMVFAEKIATQKIRPKGLTEKSVKRRQFSMLAQTCRGEFPKICRGMAILNVCLVFSGGIPASQE